MPVTIPKRRPRSHPFFTWAEKDEGVKPHLTRDRGLSRVRRITVGIGGLGLVATLAFAVWFGRPQSSSASPSDTPSSVSPTTTARGGNGRASTPSTATPRTVPQNRKPSGRSRAS
jgi:hypothetical protein